MDPLILPERAEQLSAGALQSGFSDAVVCATRDSENLLRFAHVQRAQSAALSGFVLVDLASISAQVLLVEASCTGPSAEAQGNIKPASVLGVIKRTQQLQIQLTHQLTANCFSGRKAFAPC